MQTETSSTLTKHIDWLVHVIGQTDKYSRDQKSAIQSAFRLCKHLPDREQKILAYLKCREVLPGSEESYKICMERIILKLITTEPDPAKGVRLCDDAKPYVLEGTRFEEQLEALRGKLARRTAPTQAPRVS